MIGENTPGQHSKGAVIVKSVDELSEEKAQKDSEKMESLLRGDESMPGLASHIRSAWDTNKRAKDKITDRLIKCGQLRKGVYDKKTLSEIREMGGSEIYMKIVTTKCRAAYAWIKDIILPTIGKSWGLESTPLPDLPDEIEEQIVAQLEEEIAAKHAEQIQQSGETEEMAVELDRASSEVKQMIKKEAKNSAKKAAEKMEVRIADQFEEGGFYDALDEFILDFVTYPSAVVKGAIPRKRKRLNWVNGEAVVKEEVIPTWERVSPFDIYPSPDASETWQGDLIEHIRLRRADLVAMKGVPGYSDSAIDAVLEDYGRSGLREWMFNEEERRELENKDSSLFATGNDVLIDAIHYWGSVQGKYLVDWGIEDIDPLGEYEIDAIQIGRHTIRAVKNPDPLGERPYHKASFERVQGSFWGTCPPELMEDIARVCNASARATVNNMAMSSGPMIGYNSDRLMPGFNINKIRPWMAIPFTTDATAMGNKSEKPIEFFQPQSSAASLIAIYDKFEQKSDDATNIPRYSYGNEKIGGAGATLGGLTMLMESASKGIKSAISHIDRYVIKPVVRQSFNANMLENSDPEMMGDCQVVAKGVNGIITQDIKQLKLLEILERTNNPLDLSIVGKDGRTEALRELYKSVDLEYIFPSKSEQDEQNARQSQPTQEETNKATELELKLLEIEKDFAIKAAKLQIDANDKGVPIPDEIKSNQQAPIGSGQQTQEQSGNQVIS